MDTANFRDLAVEEFNTSTLLAHANAQAVQRKYEDFFICDVDGHHWEVFNWPQISDYIEDPVLRQQAKYQGYGGGGITAPTGLYQEMAGRITRMDGRRAGEDPAGRAARPRADAALDGGDGHRRRLPLPDADAGPALHAQARGRGGDGARLQPLARRARPGRGAAASNPRSTCR